MEKQKYELHDRYSATGTPLPDPKTMCKGQCEGMGLHPEPKSTLNEEAARAKGGRLMVVGQKEKDGSAVDDDPFVFVKCPDCCGSRMKEVAEELEYGGHKWKRIT